MKWKEITDYEKKKNKENYEKFLGDYGFNHSQFVKYVGAENVKNLLDWNMFNCFYEDTLLVEREITPKDKERIMQSLLHSVLKIHAKYLAIVYNLEDWEDFFQNCWIELDRKTGIYDLEKGRNLLNFYKLIMRHKAIEMVRKQARIRAVSTEELVEELEATGKDIIAPYQFKNIDLEMALGKLPKDERKLIGLVFYNGQSQEEVAKKAGITQQAISKKLKKILEKLKKWL